MHNVNYLSAKNVFSPLHDEIQNQGYGKIQAQDLKLGVLEYMVYQNPFINTKYQVEFNCLPSLHK
jgi:Zn-dependent M16 (insulinase) family peptidase